LKDDATGFRTVYFLKTKDEAAACIRLYFAFIQNQTGHNVKFFKTDDGTEFVNSTLTECFSELGVIHITTAPFCPETNGKAERNVKRCTLRTLKDTAWAMLCQAELPEFLWAEAMACTVYIQNRILNKQSKDVTVYERIFNNAPSLHHVRLFGCKELYAQVSKEKRSAWDQKAKLYTLVGYESSSDKYRLYDPEKRCIILARNVNFDENNQLISQNENAPRPFYESDSEDEEEQVEGGEPQQQDDDDENRN
jgi:transposase InsO family protein